MHHVSYLDSLLNLMSVPPSSYSSTLSAFVCMCVCGEGRQGAAPFPCVDVSVREWHPSTAERPGFTCQSERPQARE